VQESGKMRINRQRNYYSVPKRLLKKFVIVLLIIGIPVMLFFITFRIKEVDVAGSKRYSDKQIKEMVLKTQMDYNSILLYLKYHYLKTPDIPFVEKLDIEMTTNHKITVYVYEKMVIGCVEFMGDYLYFDKDGIVVESSPKKIENVPVVNGLQFNEIVLNKKLHVLNYDKVPSTNTEINGNDRQDNEKEQNTETDQSKKLFRVILNITKLISKYELNVDLINFDENNEISLKCGDIRVLLGDKSDYEEALSDLKNILKKAKGTDLYELDMRNYDKDSTYVIGKSKKSSD
jgi:cell division protein FtsQ